VNLDDKICYCYHVSLRKLINFARRERPEKASQMSLCLGAGTGCGWCIPILKKIHAQALADADAIEPVVPGLPESAADYADARRSYLTSDQKNVF
jgi:bacterioferritin-associated ferredoxin